MTLCCGCYPQILARLTESLTPGRVFECCPGGRGRFICGEDDEVAKQSFQRADAVLAVTSFERAITKFGDALETKGSDLILDEGCALSSPTATPEQKDDDVRIDQNGRREGSDR